MQIIKPSKPGNKDYPQYVVKSSILIFSIVFGFASLVIAGTVIYLRLKLY